MKLALMGTGRAVQEALAVLQDIDTIEICAICARPMNLEKARKLADGYGIPEFYEDYDDLLDQTEAEFIYIGVVNSAHYEYARLALDAGKHVIVEKPLCATSLQVRDLLNLSLSRQLFVFEAVNPLYMPNYKGIRESLPEIRPLRLIQANFSQRSSRYDSYLKGSIHPSFDPVLYGGALYDLNVYNLSLVIDLFGKPSSVAYSANLGPNGVDTSGAAFLHYPEFTAVCTAAKDSSSPGFFLLQGENGYIRADGNPNELSTLEVNIRGRVGKFRLNQYKHRMAHEFLAFEELYREKNYSRVKRGLETSLAVAETMERAALSAGLSFGK